MTSYYRSGSECVAVEVGMPNEAVQIGTGPTPRAALESLQATPIQSAGRHAESSAILWAQSHWDIGTELKEIEVTDADLDDKMSAWE